MIVKPTVAVIGALLVAGVATPAAGQQWQVAKCDLSTKHYLVNSGVLYLRSATETKFADKRTKDLKDADKVLHEALTTGGQEKNPAAWYYLARYYALQNDLAGADTAFARAQALAPGCKEDISTWRRVFWVPVFNDGVKAWQAGNTDSAIASFRRANAIYDGEPSGFIYLGTLFANANQPDSSAKYFKLAVPAASDPKFTKEKRDALFNVARVYHAAQRWDDAVPGYKNYLAAYPNDVQAMAGLAAVYSQMGKRDDAGALYGQILDHADSAEATDLFAAAQAVDTAKVLPMAQRLVGVDPLNRTSLAKLAGAWQIRGNKDSTLRYLTIADSMTTEVTVGTFTPDEQGAKLSGLITNLKTKPSPPTAVTFEFVNAKGETVASQKQDIPAIDPSGNHAFDLRVTGAGIVAWRYRRSEW